MRIALMLALAVTVASTTAAQAQEWCGFHEKSMIECGYSSAERCETAVGKQGMCFVDPDEASLLIQGHAS
jgi:hypothetical protein